MRAMGDKINSKLVASTAGCFTIPGFQGEVCTSAEAASRAAEVGYPVMLKASAGGGGKGMRVVLRPEELEEAFRLCGAEAGASFGDQRLLIERFVEDPHHIEIQVLADHHGNIIAFPERECSVQRRNQKVVEETPSCLLDSITRRAMQLQAIALCRATGYRSAGTVEMLCDNKKNFYFLEMNTRLQVEHPVTELVSGEDLVEHMINIAAGKPLPDRLLNWAIECRVYAEDPVRGFIPSPLLTYKEPDQKAFGNEVTLSTHGPTRAMAVAAMSAALDLYLIQGLNNNLSFLQAVMTNDKFVSGQYGTSFIAEEFPLPRGFSGGVHLGEAGDRQFVAVAAAINYCRSELYYGKRDDELYLHILESGFPGSGKVRKTYEISVCLDDSLPDNNDNDSSSGSGGDNMEGQSSNPVSGSGGTGTGTGGSRDGSGLLVTMTQIYPPPPPVKVITAQEEYQVLLTAMDWRCESPLGEVTMLMNENENNDNKDNDGRSGGNGVQTE
eukprot:gene8368-17238_t